MVVVQSTYLQRDSSIEWGKQSISNDLYGAEKSFRGPPCLNAGELQNLGTPLAIIVDMDKLLGVSTISFDETLNFISRSVTQRTSW